MLFMGQEFLEDKPWSDTPDPDTLIYWDGLGTDTVMRDYLRFTQDLIWLRRRRAALRGEPCRVFHVHNAPGETSWSWRLSASRRGGAIGWDFREQDPGWIFNSDVYDNFVNPRVAGNSGAINADDPATHDMPASAEVVIPAYGLLVFARDREDR
jgi:1,4-alpha-glucan branching enzyme